jgi:hypothetical protein
MSANKRQKTGHPQSTTNTESVDAQKNDDNKFSFTHTELVKARQFLDIKRAQPGFQEDSLDFPDHLPIFRDGDLRIITYKCVCEYKGTCETCDFMDIHKNGCDWCRGDISKRVRCGQDTCNINLSLMRSKHEFQNRELQQNNAE